MLLLSDGPRVYGSRLRGTDKRAAPFTCGADRAGAPLAVGSRPLLQLTDVLHQLLQGGETQPSYRSLSSPRSDDLM